MDDHQRLCRLQWLNKNNNFGDNAPTQSQCSCHVLSSYYSTFVMLEPRISCSRVFCNYISTSLFIYFPGWIPSIDFHCARLWPFVQYGRLYCRNRCGVFLVDPGRLCSIPILKDVSDVLRNWRCICNSGFCKGQYWRWCREQPSESWC